MMKNIYALLLSVFFFSAAHAQNVGIGTAVPAQKLEVAGWVELGNETEGSAGSAGSVRYHSTGKIQFHNGTAWVDILSANNTGNFIQNQTVGNAFGTGQSASYDITGNAEIGGTLEVSGNVGIGTLTPNQKLEVVGNARITGIASGASGAIVRTNSSGDLAITNYTNNANHVLNGQGSFVDASTLTVDHDWYEVGTTTAPNNINDNIFTGGNVGIGATTPASRLHVYKDLFEESGGSTYTVATVQSGNNLGAGTLTGLHVNTSVGGSGYGSTSAIGLRVTLRRKNPNQTPLIVESQDNSEYLRVDGSGSLYVTADGDNNTFSGSPGQIALKRSSDSPYLSFHNNAGARLGYVQMDGGSGNRMNVWAQNAGSGMRFGTANTERMSIDASGNVWVGGSPSGNIVPTGLFNVNGSGNPFDDASTLSAFQQVISKNSTTNGSNAVGIGFRISSNLNATTTPGAAILLERVGGDTRGNLHLKTTRSTAETSPLGTTMTLDYTGKVGIGFTAPTQILHVGSAADAFTDHQVIRVESQGFAGIELYGDRANSGSPEKGGAYVRLSQDNGTIAGILGMIQVADTDGSGNAFTGTASNALLLGNKNNAPLHLGTNNDVKATILGNGRVGIGTTSPSEELTVAGQIDITGGGVALEVDGLEAIWSNGTYFSWGYGGTANYFADNVGIGTTAPTRLLHTEISQSGNLSTILMENTLGLTGIRPAVDGDDVVGFSNARWYQMFSLNYLNSSHTSLKSDIAYLSNADFEKSLQELRAIQSIRYKWNVDIARKARGESLETKEHAPGETPDYSLPVPVHLGFAAESLPKELLDNTGENYYISDMLGFLVASVKAVDNKVTTLEQKTEQATVSNSPLNLDGGTATMHGTELWVEFEKDFSVAASSRIPVVTVTPLNSETKLYITETTAKGFKVKCASGQEVSFNWMALVK